MNAEDNRRQAAALQAAVDLLNDALGGDKGRFCIDIVRDGRRPNLYDLRDARLDNVYLHRQDYWAALSVVFGIIDGVRLGRECAAQEVK